MRSKPFILSTRPLFFQPWWFYQRGASRTESILPCEKCTVDFSGSPFTPLLKCHTSTEQKYQSGPHVSSVSSLYAGVQSYSSLVWVFFFFLSFWITFSEEGILSISHSRPSCPAGWMGFTEQDAFYFYHIPLAIFNIRALYPTATHTHTHTSTKPFSNTGSLFWTLTLPVSEDLQYTHAHIVK